MMKSAMSIGQSISRARWRPESYGLIDIEVAFQWFITLLYLAAIPAPVAENFVYAFIMIAGA